MWSCPWLVVRSSEKLPRLSQLVTLAGWKTSRVKSLAARLPDARQFHGGEAWPCALSAKTNTIARSLASAIPRMDSAAKLIRESGGWAEDFSDYRDC